MWHSRNISTPGRGSPGSGLWTIPRLRSHANAPLGRPKRPYAFCNAWLNPRDLIDIVPEGVPRYPDRILPKNVKAAAELKKRTLGSVFPPH